MLPIVPPGWDDPLTAASVLAGQGIDPCSASPALPALLAAAATALERGRRWLEPRVALRTVRVAPDSGRGGALVLEGGATIRAAAAGHLTGADRVVMAICTVGGTIDEHAAALLAEDPVGSLALDGLGCAAVEALTRAIWIRTAGEAAEAGCRVTPPVSPGCRGWGLAEGQRVLFAVLDAAAAGVRLGGSGQMYPVKSASFAIGVGRDVIPADVRGECLLCCANGACGWQTARRSLRCARPSVS